MFKIGWFSSGRDDAAIELLRVVFDEIKKDTIKGQIPFVFVTRNIGEKKESDKFINFARSLGLDVLCLSHRNFKPELRKYALKESKKLDHDSPSLLQWRKEYDMKVISLLSDYDPDIIVLAGYMLIASPEMCLKYNMINLHPALPGGPKGTWQEVIWELMEEHANITGVMMHLITPELDAGPPVTYCQFSISDLKIQPLWNQWDEKRKSKSLEEIRESEGESEPLFKEIRRRGLMREFPLIVATLKAAADKDFYIESGKVIVNGVKLEKGFNLTEEIEKAL
ncbi:formyl transferase [Candidatus Poribacteria bacterium]|nr:formyl transferase [Candidatus Poribacteria bacterium]